MTPIKPMHDENIKFFYNLMFEVLKVNLLEKSKFIFIRYFYLSLCEGKIMLLDKI